MSWVEDAACRDHPTSWFFPGRGDDLAVQVALAICRTCPVRQDCLTDALAREDSQTRSGIVGGMTVSERARLARSRRPVPAL